MTRTSLELNQRLSQRLSQQQVRFVRLLELSAPEMDEAVERELEANPALIPMDAAVEVPRDDNTRVIDSREIDSYTSQSARYDRLSYPRYSEGRDPNEDADRTSFTPRDNSESLSDILLRQINERTADGQLREAADYIIGNLDSNGWLTRSLPLMMTDMAVNYGVDIPEDKWQEAFRLVRSLDPAGVGAESLVDCLTLQLQRMPQSQVRHDALDILNRFFREYHLRRSHKIISGLKISQQRLDAANQLILSLNPKPGAQFGGNDATAAAVIIPDFTVSEHDGELYIRLANRSPELTIEQSFREAVNAMEGRKGRTRKGSEFIVSNYREARDFIALVRQRRDTLMSVMTAIADFQKDFFYSGNVYTLRPMSLKNISAKTGLDLSVISRATNNKFVAMPWGEVLPLRSFFSGQVNAPAPGHPKSNNSNNYNNSNPPQEELTNLQLQAALKEIIDQEDPKHPLSDSALREAMTRRGYDISRRTVAKYRD
ncbi:MAG: RNA polymerase factor sigma-54, partial [Muribaculaceae bacterium]|nr:RNA polymerase factor sigma-54 [Muribaculaceae bacterium]